MKHPVVLGCVLLLLSVVVVVGARDPYTRIEGESMDVNNGATVTADTSVSGGKYASGIQPGDHIGFNQLNFSAETAAFQWQLYNANAYSLQSQVLLRLDSPTSAPLLTTVVPHGGGHWIQSTVLIPEEDRPRGVRDLYFVFQHPKTAGDLVHVDWFRFLTLDSLLPRSLALCPVETVSCPASQSHPNAPHWHSPDGNQKQVFVNIY